MQTNFPFKLIHTCFWLAPTLMFLSDFSRLVFGEPAFWVATHLFWLSFYAFLGVIFGMIQLADYSRYAVISAIIAGFGALIGITIIGMARMAWGLEAEGATREMILAADANLHVFLSSRFPGITFPLGLILLAIGLKRKKLISNYLLTGLILSIVLFPAGRIPKELIINVIGDGLMILCFGMLGNIYLRQIRDKIVT